MAKMNLAIYQQNQRKYGITNPLPPSAAASQAALLFASADEVAQVFANLYFRWQDEKEYEDIKDYVKPFKHFEEKYGVKIVDATKRPFGIVYMVDNRVYQYTRTGYMRIG